MIPLLLLRTAVAITAGVLFTFLLMCMVWFAQWFESQTGISGIIWFLIGGAITIGVWAYDALT